MREQNFHLMNFFGRIARDPSHEPVIEENLEPTYRKYLEDLNDKLFQVKTLAYENLTRAKEYYDRKINLQNCKVGNSIYDKRIKKGETIWTKP